MYPAECKPTRRRDTFVHCPTKTRIASQDVYLIAAGPAAVEPDVPVGEALSTFVVAAVAAGRWCSVS